MIGRGAVLAEVLQHVVRSTKAAAIYWNRRYEPGGSSNAIAKLKLQSRRTAPTSRHLRAICSSSLRTCSQRKESPIAFSLLSGRRAVLQGEPIAPFPVPAPTGIRRHAGQNRSTSTRSSWNPRSIRAAGFRDVWTPGEQEATRQLTRFRDEASANTSAAAIDRIPSAPRGYHPICTSAKSRRGKCEHAFNDGKRQGKTASSTTAGPSSWPSLDGVKSHHVLFHFPHTSERPLREEFQAFSLAARRCGAHGLAAWANGLSDRRRRHARAVDDRLDAQPRANDRRLVPDQRFADLLA